MTEQCALIEQAFYDRFGVRPLVSFEDVMGYGRNFLIWKLPTMCGKQIMYYKIGKSLQTALWFVDEWKYPPSALVTFADEEEKKKYSLEMQQEENEKTTVRDIYNSTL